MYGRKRNDGCVRIARVAWAGFVRDILGVRSGDCASDEREEKASQTTQKKVGARKVKWP